MGFTPSVAIVFGFRLSSKLPYHSRILNPLTSILHSDRIYHEADYQLRKQNKFVLGNLGSDLKTMASSIGLLKCRSEACGHSPLRSLLANVKFHLGDEDLSDHAAIMRRYLKAINIIVWRCGGGLWIQTTNSGNILDQESHRVRYRNDFSPSSDCPHWYISCVKCAFQYLFHVEVILTRATGSNTLLSDGTSKHGTAPSSGLLPTHWTIRRGILRGYAANIY